MYTVGIIVHIIIMYKLYIAQTNIYDLSSNSSAHTESMRGVSPCSPPLKLTSAPPSSTRATMIAVCPCLEATWRGE